MLISPKQNVSLNNNNALGRKFTQSSLFDPSRALIYTLKHQLTLMFKTLKNLLKTFW